MNIRKILKRILEKRFRNKIFLKTLRYKDMATKWYITPDSQLKYLKNRVDSDLFSFVEKNVAEGNSVWDIGANCGTFIAACKMSGKNLNVLAVEPDHFLIRVLTSNLDLYPFKLLNCAVAQHSDILSLDIAERGRASNSLSILKGRQDKGGTRYKQLVSVVSLDFLAGKFEIPDIIKMDIEGAEIMALLGAAEIIGARKTQFLIEVDGANRAEMRGFFDESKYFVDELWPDNFHIFPK